jgi:predicted  nucleic acid-binding Zn-ribbon protein
MTAEERLDRIDATWKAIQRLAEESRSAAVEFRTMLAELRTEAERRDQKTDERIQALVSSIGDLIRAMRPKDLQ